MRDNRIEELWRSYFVDRQVYAALTDLFNTGDPSRDLVNLVTRRVPTLSRTDVRDSLIRARASFDFPSAGTIAGSARPTPAASAPPLPPTAASPNPPTAAPSTTPPLSRRVPERVTADERRTTLQDVLACGRLRAGDTLVTDYRGCGHTAEVLSDGTIRYRDQTYQSLSAAGEAVKVALLGPDIRDTIRATDGWGFWRATDARSGETVTLKQLRRPRHRRPQPVSSDSHGQLMAPAVTTFTGGASAPPVTSNRRAANVGVGSCSERGSALPSAEYVGTPSGGVCAMIGVSRQQAFRGARGLRPNRRE